MEEFRPLSKKLPPQDRKQAIEKGMGGALARYIEKKSKQMKDDNERGYSLNDCSSSDATTVVPSINADDPKATIPDGRAFYFKLSLMNERLKIFRKNFEMNKPEYEKEKLKMIKEEKIV